MILPHPHHALREQWCHASDATLSSSGVRVRFFKKNFVRGETYLHRSNHSSRRTDSSCDVLRGMVGVYRCFDRSEAREFLAEHHSHSAHVIFRITSPLLSAQHRATDHDDMHLRQQALLERVMSGLSPCRVMHHGSADDDDDDAASSISLFRL